MSNKCALLIILTFTAAACQRGPEQYTLAPPFPGQSVWETQGVGIEGSGGELGIIAGPGAKSPRLALEGEGLTLADWSKFDRLAIELWNPLETDLHDGGFNFLTLELVDSVGARKSDPLLIGNAAIHYGLNRLERRLVNLATASGRPLDLSRMAGLGLRLNPSGDLRTLSLRYIGLETPADAPRFTRLSKFRLFDFGTPLSPLFPQAVRVTAATKFDLTNSYGWVDHAPYMGLSPGGPDPLTSDLVVPGPDGRGRMKFRVVTGRGEKLVWCLTLPLNGYYGPVHPWSISADGKVAASGRVSAGDFLSVKGHFRWMDAFFTPGQDPWALYVNPFYRQHLFRVPSDGEYVDLEFENLSVYGLAIFPAGKESAGMKALRKIQAWRRETFHREFILPPPESDEDEEEPARPVDYILFHRDYVEDVLPDTRPRPEDVVATLEVAVARGERDHATFTVHPLTDLGKVRVRIGEAATDDGRKLSDVSISTRVVRYLWPGLDGSRGVYQPEPAYLYPVGDGVPASAGANRRFWLTVHAGRRAAPGEYFATIHIEPERGERSELGLRIRVLPISLPGELPITIACSHPGINDLNYYFGYLPGGDGLRAETIRREVRNLKTHGFNGMEIPGPGIARYDGNLPVVDFRELNVYLEVFRKEKFGLRGRCPADVNRSLVRPLGEKFGYNSRGFDRALTHAVRQIVDYQRRYGFHFYLHLGEGPRSVDRNPWNMERDLALRVGRLIESVRGAGPSLIIGSDVDRDETFHPLALPLTTVITRPWSRSRRLIVQANLTPGRNLWFTGLQPGRYVSGFYLWRSDPRGYLQPTYERNRLGFYPFDFSDGVRGLALPSPDGPLDTPDYERFSRGIDDYRFLKALESMIDRGSKRGEVGRLKREIATQLERLAREIPVINGDPLTDVSAWRAALNDYVLRLAAAGGR